MGALIRRLWEGGKIKARRASLTIFLSRSQQVFSVNGQIGFVGHTVSVATIHFCHCGTKAVR